MGLIQKFKNLFSCKPERRKYRQQKGGKWYKICSATGQDDAHWTQEKPMEGSGWVILKKEKYSLTR